MQILSSKAWFPLLEGGSRGIVFWNKKDGKPEAKDDDDDEREFRLQEVQYAVRAPLTLIYLIS